MNERKSDDKPHAPGEAEGDGRALHGYRNEVSWDEGRGRQPYANQGEEEQGPGTGKETEAGDRGAASGRNLAQLDEVKEKPQQRPESEVPREA